MITNMELQAVERYKEAVKNKLEELLKYAEGLREGVLPATFMINQCIIELHLEYFKFMEEFDDWDKDMAAKLDTGVAK